MYWSSAGCFQPSARAELLPKEFVWSMLFAEDLSSIALPISEELTASSDRFGIRVDRLFADPEIWVVADEGVTDNRGVFCMYFAK